MTAAPSGAAPNEWATRVRFAEVDSLHVVHHSRYWMWFEEARYQFLYALLDLTPAAITDLGVALPLIAAECRYGRAVRWGTDVVVRVWLEPQRAAKLVFRHELVDAHDPSIQYATARTTHVFTDRQLRLRATVPEPYRHRLTAARDEQPWAFAPEGDAHVR